MTKGTFSDRVNELRRSVGSGKLSIQCEVDQIYAHYQETHPEFHHPDGGGAFYLRDSLYLYANDFCRDIATVVLDGGLQDAAKRSAETMATQVYHRAPWEFGDLRASGHPIVTLGEEVVYDRPPAVARQNPAELREKAHLRYLFDPHRYRSR